MSAHTCTCCAVQVDPLAVFPGGICLVCHEKRFNAEVARTGTLPRPDFSGTIATRRKPRLTPAQKKALAAYQFAEKQEDRYMGSVFVTTAGQRQAEARTAAAYQACKALEMTHEHGL